MGTGDSSIVERANLLTDVCCGAHRSTWAVEKRGEVNYGDNKLPRLNIKVAKETVPRAFRLLQALFTALEQRGHKATATKEGKTILTVLDEPLEISLREPSKQARHVPTAKEIADAKKYSWSRPAPYDLVSSGTLVLNIENVWGVRHTWKDGKTLRLEDVLNDVVVGLLDLVVIEPQDGLFDHLGAERKLLWGARLPDECSTGNDEVLAERYYLHEAVESIRAARLHVQHAERLGIEPMKETSLPGWRRMSPP